MTLVEQLKAEANILTSGRERSNARRLLREAAARIEEMEEALEKVVPHEEVG